MTGAATQIPNVVYYNAKDISAVVTHSLNRSIPKRVTGILSPFHFLMSRLVKPFALFGVNG